MSSYFVSKANETGQQRVSEEGVEGPYTTHTTGEVEHER